MRQRKLFSLFTLFVLVTSYACGDGVASEEEARRAYLGLEIAACIRGIIF